MKISTVIRRLQEIQSKHGDLRVCADNYYCPVTRFLIFKARKARGGNRVALTARRTTIEV